MGKIKFKALFILLVTIPSVGFSKDLSQISVQCIGTATESIVLGQSKPSERKYQNYPRYYQLSDNEIVEHIGTLSMTTTRKDIEAKDDSEKTHMGIYTFNSNVVSFLEMTGYRKFVWNSFRSFTINRRTGAWELNEMTRGGLDGDENRTKHLTVNGNCEPWDSKQKF